MKICGCCGIQKPFSGFTPAKGGRNGLHTHCKACRAAAIKEKRRQNPAQNREIIRQWRRRNPERMAYLERKYKLRRFDLTPEKFEEMKLAQGGVCAICQLPSSGRRLSVDHDHKTGKVRKLLCSACNTGIGQLKESPDILTRAILYLKEYADISS